MPESWNDLTRRVIACAMEVHSALGPGFLERLYEEALLIEFAQRGISAERQVPVRVQYKNVDIGLQRLDLVVEGLVILELKAVAEVPNSALAQLTSYMRAADLPLGLLINFHVPRLKDGVYRRINPRAISRLHPVATHPLSASSDPL